MKKTIALAALCAAITTPVFADIVGHASYYGREFAGRRTANGERFNPNAMTAAHRSLPFGTVLRVTNVSNGRSAVLRINDRGPFIRGRVLDVSHGAARVLGFAQAGTARLRMEAIDNRVALAESGTSATGTNGGQFGGVVVIGNAIIRDLPNNN